MFLLTCRLRPIVQQHDNIFKLTCDSTIDRRIKMSPEYTLDGVTVQFKVESEMSDVERSFKKARGINPPMAVHHCTYYIKFKKILQNDQDYTLKVSSEKINITNKILLTDYLGWHRIGETSNCNRIDFDVTIEIDVVRTTNTPFKHLNDDTELTDFEIVGKDGFIKIHMAVLIGFSPEFKEKLSFLEKLRSKKETLASKETLEHLKSYMYLQKLPEDGIKQLAELAIDLDMTDLTFKCCVKLLNEVTTDNVLCLLDFATTHKLHMVTIGILSQVENGYMSVDDISMAYAHREQ